MKQLLSLFLLLAFFLNVNINAYALTREEINEKYPSVLRLQILMNELKKKYVGLDSYIDALALALLSKEHIYVYGSGGGAKTAVAKDCMNYIDGKITSIQCTEATRIEEVRGVPIAKDFLEKGDISYNLENALVSFDVVYIDEFDSLQSSVMESLMTTLNERSVMLGGKTSEQKGSLKTAIITSNSSVYQMLEQFPVKKKSKGEAFFNRIMYKTFVANMSPDMESVFNILNAFINNQIESNRGKQAFALDKKINLNEFYDLIEEEISLDNFLDVDLTLGMSVLFERFSKIAKEKIKTEKDKLKDDPESLPLPYYPTCRETNRDIGKMITSIRAGKLLAFIKGEVDDLNIELTDIKYVRNMLTSLGGSIDYLNSLKGAYVDDEATLKMIDDNIFEQETFDMLYKNYLLEHQDNMTELIAKSKEMIRN